MVKVTRTFEEMTYTVFHTCYAIFLAYLTMIGNIVLLSAINLFIYNSLNVFIVDKGKLNYIGIYIHVCSGEALARL